ncbi:MAG: hypothetical protein RLZZ427_1510 [Pseudomonadota bacterium]
MLVFAAILGAGGGGLGLAPRAMAQPVVDYDNDLDAQVASRITITRNLYGAPPPRRRCDTSGGDGAIVVCAPDRGEDLRVPSTAESDPASLAARRELNNGIPRAPQLDRGSCRGQAGCVIGGWAPPPVYMIDVKAIPEPPEGSDADLIAKGEKAAP